MPQNLKKWDQEVLAATLESKFVRNLIKKNEAALPQVDTILEYRYSRYRPDVTDYLTASVCNKQVKESMELGISSGSDNVKSIQLERKPFALESDEDRNLSKEMLVKIEELDKNFEINNKIQQSLEDIKKLAAEVIYTE